MKTMGLDAPDDVEDDKYAIPRSDLPDSSNLGDQPLCTGCANIRESALQSKEGYLHSRDLGQLVSAAEQCRMCKLMSLKLWEGMVHSRKSCSDSPYANFTTEQLLEGIFRLASERGMALLSPTPLILKFEGSTHEVDGRIMGRPAGFTLGVLFKHEGVKDTARPLLPRGDAQEVLDRMKKWMVSCDRNVKIWSTRLDGTCLPTRVLDLGTSTADDSADIRLWETKGAHGRYATLSYCWGGYNEVRTLKSNLQDRCVGISWTELPSVFQQAVTVTRGLGIQYLWIDALCIVQDDAVDWRAEAGQMANVYWNGACRLAITHCRDPTQNFFPPKDIAPSVYIPNLERPSEKRWQDGVPASKSSAGGFHEPSQQNLDGKSADADNESEWESCTESPDSGIPGKEPGTEQDGTDTSAPFLDGFTEALDRVSKRYSKRPKELPEQRKVFFTLPKNYARDVDGGHLNSRGWVLQERLLAPRTIHFTENHIYFEDQDDICGEDWVRKQFTWLSCVNKDSKLSRSMLFREDSFRSVEHVRRGEPEFAKLSASRSLFGQQNYRHQADTRHSWLRIAESFSRCKFTYNTDKIVAISGLVRRKQNISSSPYVGSANRVGLWDVTMHIDLTWVAAGRHLTYLSEMMLPRWSWMAYTGNIAFVCDRRDIRESTTVRRPATSEMRLVHADVPDLQDVTNTGPLPGKPSITIAAKVRKLHCTAAQMKEGIERSWKTRDDMPAMLPYIRFERSTRTIPILLGHLSATKDVHDGNGNLIGMVSFDERALPTGPLFCVHVSTLHDTCMHSTMEEPKTSKARSASIPMPPILAYALVVRPVDGSDQTYARVGLAELDYAWITAGDEEVIRLV
ncbi:heterokaryon incompatibility protein-domain-containing protein [Phaeosphaeria sp. MPI-PUGE-AT-0046c]|nr:heterokaryon incompatibility protein-domain-containing protein [Phaeosphaeria sp. MPI-PUGE-AT-0046c]